MCCAESTDTSPRGGRRWLEFAARVFTPYVGANPSTSATGCHPQGHGSLTRASLPKALEGAGRVLIEQLVFNQFARVHESVLLSPEYVQHIGQRALGPIRGNLRLHDLPTWPFVGRQVHYASAVLVAGDGLGE